MGFFNLKSRFVSQILWQIDFFSGLLKPQWEHSKVLDHAATTTAFIGLTPGFSTPIPAWQEDYRGISSCMFLNTYIRLNDGNGFWFYPTQVDRQTIVGYRWSGSGGWNYHAINRDRMQSYQCFG